eukprot:1415247-Alexandrium_andersonii.AAC.1
MVMFRWFTHGGRAGLALVVAALAAAKQRSGTHHLCIRALAVAASPHHLCTRRGPTWGHCEWP